MDEFGRKIEKFTGRRPVPRVEHSASVADVIEVMRGLDSHCVFVEKDGEMVGVFTERDLLRRVADDDLDVVETKVSAVMTANPESLRATDNIAYAINKMAVGKYRNIPIVDGKGHLRGALSVRDVVEHISDVFSDESEVDGEWVEIGGG